MIPQLIDVPKLRYRLLPPGIHVGSLREINDRFVFNNHRKILFDGFVAFVEALRIAGCATIYLDGSFVSDKPIPQDYDGCWDPTGVNVAKLDPVLLDFDNGRAAQKSKYLGEMFIATMSEISGKTFLDFFQTERTTGKAKGIILIKPLVDKAAS